LTDWRALDVGGSFYLCSAGDFEPAAITEKFSLKFEGKIIINPQFLRLQEGSAWSEGK
jgi:hypothetical protein